MKKDNIVILIISLILFSGCSAKSDKIDADRAFNDACNTVFDEESSTLNIENGFDVKKFEDKTLKKAEVNAKAANIKCYNYNGKLISARTDGNKVEEITLYYNTKEADYNSVYSDIDNITKKIANTTLNEKIKKTISEDTDSEVNINKEIKIIKKITSDFFIIEITYDNEKEA